MTGAARLTVTTRPSRGDLMKEQFKLLLGGLLLFTPVAVGAQSPTFGQPTISGIQGVGFEQDIRLDPTNASRVYTSVPGSLSSDTSWIWHSRDGGKSFKLVTASLPKTGQANSCADGGDTELAVDTGGEPLFYRMLPAEFTHTPAG